MKGETIEQAAKRKALEELGIDIELSRTLGIYEHFHRRGHHDSRHSISIVVFARPKSFEIRLDSQSSDWKLSPRLPVDFKMTRFGPRQLEIGPTT